MKLRKPDPTSVRDLALCAAVSGVFIASVTHFDWWASKLVRAAEVGSEVFDSWRQSRARAKRERQLLIEQYIFALGGNGDDGNVIRLLGHTATTSAREPHPDGPLSIGAFLADREN